MPHSDLMRKEKWWQYALIGTGLITTFLFSVFFYREIHPEYRIYQDDFIALENFRASYKNEQPAPFKLGVKQIVLEQEDKGPAIIDRCTSCHVALQIEDYSPTRIAKDINGNIKYDSEGIPLQEKNPNYVWEKLDLAIQDLKAQGKESQALDLEALKTAEVGHHLYDVKKVLAMHPLMGKETRPFEFHPIEEYGCTSCHSGNGRGLTTEYAHGPLFDGEYEIESRGFVPKFLEIDPKNDPKFSRVFNDKPGHELLFQTTPILVGALIQSKCIQCHQDSTGALNTAKDAAERALSKKEKTISSIEKGYQSEKKEVISLLNLNQMIQQEGLEKTTAAIEAKTHDFTLPAIEQEQASSQLKILKRKDADQEIQKRLLEALGSKANIELFLKNGNDIDLSIKQAREEHSEGKGTLFEKEAALNFYEDLLQHVKNVSGGVENILSDEEVIGQVKTDVDLLTQDYQRGRALFLSQACYSCHRIAGFSRGGVGPELTRIGDGYPWYIKESIVWPQADLKSSTMPNMRLDHEELEALVTYLLAQTARSKVYAEPQAKASIQMWEAGKKQPWEKAVSPKDIQNVRYGMTVFAVEGCASCHRLRGFTSNVGFAIEKETEEFAALNKERTWFKKLFPEQVLGTQIVKTIEKHQDEIEKRIISDVRQNSIVEEIEAKHPQSIEALYSNFKYALRAKNHLEKSVSERWKKTVRNVLYQYIQIYGLGRLICPKPSWSGVYRSDQWLIEHFKNPTSHVPRSIMPAFPFDETKFYALTFMLDALSKENVEEDRKVWELEGFQPQVAYNTYCFQCHGTYRHGNGPVAEWLYPIPKDLRREDFIRNLTKERAVQSIIHGVAGTPMPPWGELGADKPFENRTPVMTEKEIRQLVDWLFSTLGGESAIPREQDVPKWRYKAEDVIDELNREKSLPLNMEANQSSLFPLSLFLAQLPAETKMTVEDVFDVVPSPKGPDENMYFIKEKYYTSQNIEKGRHFFVENCSPCHGKEADGSGARAEAMYEAKPRMLTNLDWIQTRDDLRLIRSIKFGVPGTSMTPWGDFTSSLQRIQLVVFIRSLSEDKEERRSLTNALYTSFDASEYALERYRLNEYAVLADLEDRLNAARTSRVKLDQAVKSGAVDPEKALKAYQEELKESQALKSQQEKDKIYLSLREEIKKQKELYFALGVDLLNLHASDSILNTYLDLIKLNDNHFKIEDGVLSRNQFNEEKEKQTEERLFKLIDQEMENYSEKEKELSGRIFSAERNIQLNEAKNKKDAWIKIKNLLRKNLAEIRRSRVKENDFLQLVIKKTEKT